jgi:hypothetical protein
MNCIESASWWRTQRRKFTLKKQRLSYAELALFRIRYTGSSLLYSFNLRRVCFISSIRLPCRVLFASSAASLKNSQLFAHSCASASPNSILWSSASKRSCIRTPSAPYILISREGVSHTNFASSSASSLCRYSKLRAASLSNRRKTSDVRSWSLAMNSDNDGKPSSGCEPANSTSLRRYWAGIEWKKYAS